MAESLRGTLGVYRRLVGARVRGDLQYRASFAFRAAAATLIGILEFVAIALLFGRVHRLAGWSLAEAALLYGMARIAFSVADIVVGGIEVLAGQVKQGTFDRLLLRPLSPLGQLAADEFALRQIGDLIQSTAVLAVAIVAVDTEWSIGRAGMVPVALLAGTGIYAAVWIATTAATFWTVEGSEFANAFVYGGAYLTQYPVSIFGPWVRRFLVFGVPMAFVAYFPALYILGRTDEADRFGLPYGVVFVSPLVAVAACAAAGIVWRQGIRHYRSTGS